ncbi:sensor histidine kinase [Sphingobacterium sp. HJSM2_6]|uniref:sensor histidine kinase n=1 Tax=Sphingobacterium sp. HJSM2_6 TaxID=3366264 RepID=UPI003BDDA0D7
MRKFLTILLHAFLLSSCIYALFALYFLFKNGSIEIAFFKSIESFKGILYGVTLYLSGSYTGELLQKNFPKETQSFKRLFYYIVITIIVNPIMIFIIHYSSYSIWYNASFKEFIEQENWFRYIPLVLFSLIIGLIFYAIYFYKYFKNKQINQHKQIAGEATAKLSSLQSQIDPHFLFNSLNVLIGLIEEDKTKAIAYTKSLSSIYRYILEQKNDEKSRVIDELKFAKNYINLMKLRFEEGLNYSAKEEDFEASLYVASLSLQLLLENCIQHNKINEESPLHIQLYRETNYLVVQNNLQLKTLGVQSTQIGLKNIKERYAFLTKIPVQYYQTPEFFIVKIPLLKT